MSKRRGGYYDFDNIVYRINKENRERERAIRNYERQKQYKEKMQNQQRQATDNEIAERHSNIDTFIK
jgi:hypothetical protein